MTLFDAEEIGAPIHGTVSRDLRVLPRYFETVYGVVSPLTGSWLPGRIEIEILKTCDWGFCDRPTVAARYDAKDRQWYPVCETCATAPI